MNIFSEESRLIIENYATVQDIIEAKSNLDKELARFLHSIEDELTGCDWWEDNWIFVPHQDAQVYITNRKWQLRDVYAIWIGVENFNGTGIFGNGNAPRLYVWVALPGTDLIERLTAMLRQEESDLMGNIMGTGTRYVVQHPLKSYIAGDVEAYLGELRAEMLEFFTFYAKLLPKYVEEVIRRENH